MEVYLPSSARQHYVYGRRETSSQRMETEAPITMVMAIGDQANSQKKERARFQAQRYRKNISTLPLDQLLRVEVAVLDFMSFVDYGDGLSLPAEVGVARGCLGELHLEKCRVYGGIPHIPYQHQRTGFASDAKDTCERVHGIDILDYRTSKVDLDIICAEMKTELEGNPLFLCRSEDLNRVLGCWHWLQDNPAVGTLDNIGVMTIEDFLMHTLTRLHQLSGIPEGGVPTFSQFTTLLTRSANDLNAQFRCEYHNSVEMAWNKTGCARKNAIKYLGTISECINPEIANCRRQARVSAAPLPPPTIVPAPTARAEFQAGASNGAYQEGAVAVHSDQSNGYTSRPNSREGSVHSSSSSSSYSSALMELPGESFSSQSSLDSSVKSKTRGRRCSPGSVDSGFISSKDTAPSLLTPNYFKVSKNLPNGYESASSRSDSPPSAPQRVRSPHSALLTSEVIPTLEQDTVVPAPPRRPESSFSARKSCSTSCPKKAEQPLPSSGVTNLPLRGGPDMPGPSQNVVTPAAGEISCVTGLPRRPVSFSNRGKKVGKLPLQTHDTNNKPRTPPPREAGTASYSPPRTASRSGTSTVPPDAALVPATVVTTAVAPTSFAAPIAPPTSLATPAVPPTAAATFPGVAPASTADSDAISAAFALASAAQSAATITPSVPSAPVLAAAPAAPPHPAFLQAFSAAESTSQTVSGPPPGFDPVPKYRTIPLGFAVEPLPSRNTRPIANLNESVSSEDSVNSPDARRRVNKPVKRRGRN